MEGVACRRAAAVALIIAVLAVKDAVLLLQSVTLSVTNWTNFLYVLVYFFIYGADDDWTLARAAPFVSDDGTH